MNRLEKLKELIDKRLHRVEFTQADQAQVYDKIEARKKSRRRSYTFGFSLGAVALAAAMFALVILPAIGGLKNQAGPDMVAENSTSSVSDTAVRTESTTTEDSLDSDNAPQPLAAAPSASGVLVTALRASGSSGVVKCDSGFSVNTENAEISASDVKDLIRIEPEVPFTVSVEEDNLCYISFSDTLPAGQIIRLSLGEGAGENSWAFQTESTMTVRATTPGDGTRGMPLDTGIEVRFSLTPDDSAKDYFSISPQVGGSFLTRGKTLIFVPETDLDADRAYTITLKAGLPARSGETLESDYTFSFRTPTRYWEEGSGYFYDSGSIAQSFIPHETIAFSVIAGDQVRESTLFAQIYKLSSLEEYADLLKESYENTKGVSLSGDQRFDLSGKTPFIQTELSITELQINEWMTNDVIILPELEEGWYAVRVTAPEDAGGKSIDKLIQVSPLSVYYESVEGEALVWCNTSSGALSGAQIRYAQDDAIYAAATDGDGIARLKNENAGSALVTVTSSAGSFADMVEATKADEKTIADDFFTYLYLDRSAYLPTDTIHFWGMLVPKTANASMPSRAELKLETYIGQPRSIGSVQIASDGSFAGEFSIENYVSGDFLVDVCVGDVTLVSNYFLVTDYTKPSYVLELTLDKPFYRAGETAHAAVKASFFDGTPACGLSVRLDLMGESLWYTTDADGCIDAEFVPTVSGTSWRSDSFYVSAQIVGVEDVYVWASAFAQYFRSPDMLTAAQTEGSTAVEIRANRIDFALLAEHLTDYWSDPDLIRGENAALSGTVTLVKHYFEKNPTGYYYDEILKRRVDTYDYELVEEIAEQVDFTTVNGYAKTKDFTLEKLEYGWYTAKIEYNDENGQYLAEEIHLGRETWPRMYGSNYYFESAGDALSIGEKTTLQLKSPDNTSVSSGRLLCTVVGDALLSAQVETDGVFDFTFTRDCVPNVWVFAAYFDGMHVNVVPSCWFEYKVEDQALSIEITPSKERYAPGEEGSARIEVRDRDGNPVQTNFVLSIVDEAAFAVMEQEERPLARLYAWRRYPNIVCTSSYTDVKSVSNVAEGGGEGGTDGLRENFKDIALFYTGKTDAQGVGEATFKMPDNLTAWRLTAVAVTSDGKAGIQTKDAPVSLEYFMTLLLGDRYTEGDSVSMAARVYGVAAGQPVEYELYLDDDYVGSTNGVSGDYTFLDLGKLEAGTYEVGIRAICGENEDGMIRTIRVQKSRHSFLHYTSGLLSDGVKLDADRYPVTMLVYDSANNAYIGALSYLLSSGSARADFHLGASAAYDKFKALYPDTWISKPDTMNWQDYDGGVRLLPYAQADVLTTALALVAAPEQIDAYAAGDYLANALNDYDASSEDVCAAYMGLAALGEPVLADVNTLLADYKPGDPEYAYLTAALALLGDRASAGKNYDALYGGKLKTLGDTLYYAAFDAEESYAGTASALMLASILGREDADALARYLLESSSASTAPNFALMVYVRAYQMTVSHSAFTCRIDGETKTYDFGDIERGVVVLEFGDKALDYADFRVTRGEVSYFAIYSATLGENEQSAGVLASVSLTPDRVDAGVNETLDLTVSLNVAQQCLDDTFIIDLVLPAGVRYSGFEDHWDGSYYLISNEKGRLRFVVTRWNRESNPNARSAFSVSFRVHTTTVLPGSFVLEEPVVQLPASNLMAYGARGAIEIR